MRQARIKLPVDEGPGVYHVMSRTVNGERLFDDVAKEVFRKQLWQVGDYTGVEIITYAILSNHFHVLVRVPQRTAIADAELIRRYRVLYPSPTRYQTKRFELIQSELMANGPEALRWRKSQLALMGDISPFMKLLKQRFSIWYNKTHRRYGTLWAERFKSVLVEPKENILETLAAYIELNSIRAGLVQDPKDYRFCGYAEAVAGSARARRGIGSIGPANRNWEQTQRDYRQRLFGTGASPRESAGGITREDFERVIREQGRLPLATVLRCRLRYFTDGAVLGTRAHVEAQRESQRRRFGREERTEASTAARRERMGDLAVLRRLGGAGF